MGGSAGQIVAEMMEEENKPRKYILIWDNRYTTFAPDRGLRVEFFSNWDSLEQRIKELFDGDPDRQNSFELCGEIGQEFELDIRKVISEIGLKDKHR